jgi:lysophospholipase L1-like esterase
MRRTSLLAGLLILASCAGSPATTQAPTVTTSQVPAGSQALGTPSTGLVVAAFGDSIAGEAGSICAGCTPFVDRYAQAIAAELVVPVDVARMGRPSLRVADLLRSLESDSGVMDAAASADAIIVAVGTSDAPWNLTDDECDGPATGMEPVPWDQYSAECISGHVESLRPIFDGVFARLVELRAGAPTILRTVNLYNDWIGFDPEFPPEGVEMSVAYLEAMNAMICETAAEHGFECGDVSAAFNGADGRHASGDLLAEDYIHPSDAGHERIAAVLLELGFAPLTD